MPETPYDPISTGQIHALLRRSRMDMTQIMARTRIRRLLTHRNPVGINEANGTGTNIPDPFSRSSLAIRTMIGQAVEGVIHYQSRFSANPPNPQVMPLTVKDSITARADKNAGNQELFYKFLLDQMGIGPSNRWNQRKCAFAQATSEIGYYTLLPSDLSFGLPDRNYFGDEEAEFLREQGILAPGRTERGWAEHADRWRDRRKQASKQRGMMPGNKLFDLQCYPRDMVFAGKDSDPANPIKWAAVVQEVPSEDCQPGGNLAMAWARHAGKPMDDWALYGIWKGKDGKIFGGIERGGPMNAHERSGTWTLIKFFTRLEVVYLVSSANNVEEAYEVYRERHGCRIMGQPACPVVEVPAMRTDIDVPGMDAVGPMSQVFAIVPLINQIMTLLSNAGAFNAIPRWVIELKDGSILRDDTGQPKVLQEGPAPGLDPKEAAAYPGTLKQLTVDVDSLLKLLPIYLDLLQASMPAPAASGSKAENTAWSTAQAIQQSQLTLAEPVENHAWAVTVLLQMCNEWLRDLDVPIYFFQVPQGDSQERQPRGLVEFDPADLTDSFRVTQSNETPDERIVMIQVGMQLYETGFITLREFFEEFMKVSDGREAIIGYWQNKITQHVMGIAPADPTGVIFQIAEGIRGEVHYELIKESPAYALSVARGMASAAQQSMAMDEQAQMASAQGETEGLGGGVTEAAGIRRPGVGMNASLPGQQGASAPQMTPPSIPMGV